MPLSRNIQVQVGWGFEQPGVVAVLKHWFKQWANSSLSVTAGSLLPWFCFISSTLFYIPVFNFFPSKNVLISSAFLCSPVAYMCFQQLSIENQPWLFSKLSLLKWQQQRELSEWLYYSVWRKDERIFFSLNFIQADLSSVHTDYSNEV